MIKREAGFTFIWALRFAFQIGQMTLTAVEDSAKFSTPQVTNFLVHLQEATRANPNRDATVYIPVSGGEVAKANYHHFVFGQRGAGKSSLLRHLESEVKDATRISAWLDQEIFSNLSYPDVLVSAVSLVFESTLEAILAHEKLTAKKDTRWQKLLILIKFRSPTAKMSSLALELSQAVEELQKLKFAPIDRKIEWTHAAEKSKTRGGKVGGTLPVLAWQASLDKSSATRDATTMKETTEGTKDQYLERSLTIYRGILARASNELGGGFIFVDDLYQIRRSDQALVLGYMHRLVKDTELWLKIGSIRYSTEPFINGDPPRGMQIGHDAHEIALDRGMRHLQSTQVFLEKIMLKLCLTAKVDFNDLFTIDARKRLVMAAGGVARDYLRITSAAILEARNRGVTSKTGSHRVTVEDVNKGAGTLASSKLDELKKDEPEDSQALTRLVQDLTEFCRRTKCAYFLVSTEEQSLSTQINKLQHLRFTHLVAESETIRDRGSQRFNVWLLDVAELSAQRATVGMDFLGWGDRSKRRNRRLIYTEGAGATSRDSVENLHADADLHD